MNAAIDIGSNSIRLLIGEACCGIVSPLLYRRQITRLAGGLGGCLRLLNPESMEKSLATLESFVELTSHHRCRCIRAVATEALRRADNASEFVHLVSLRTGLKIDIIEGCEEARLSAIGARSALLPLPESYLLIDIGGGSCEFTLQQGEVIRFHRSYSLGVVTLSEHFPDNASRSNKIEQTIDSVQADLRQADLLSSVKSEETVLVGTAGTVTTLAAMKLQMTVYDWRQVNNLQLERHDLLELHHILSRCTPLERETLPGMEAGRGDLIVSGLEIVLGTMHAFAKPRLVVSDFGLLEGVLLSL